MGAEKGSASGGGSASKAGMSNKSAATSPVVQGIKADQYARKKLGIVTTVAGPVKGASTSVTGFYSTKSKDQMYGSEYQAARNEYLASQGLGTMQKNGSFTTGVQTDKGLVFTSQAREAYEASKREPIPLSRQMYDSQKRVGATAFGIMGAMMGMPTLGLTLASNIYNKPYSSYVNLNRYNTYFTPTSGGGRDGGSNTTTSTTGTTATPVIEDSAKKQASLTAARVKEMAAASKRQFYKISGKSITGKMSPV
jgi:hypothetical protein